MQPPVIRDYGMRQMYVSDPDGYTLCFQWPVAWACIEGLRFSAELCVPLDVPV